MSIKSKSILTLLSVGIMTATYSQKPDPATCLAGIKKADVSELWCQRNSAKDSEEADLPEPLGFIGDQYQRFYIHYTSVIKSKINPYQYFVKGKTKVKDYVCNFIGTITITKAVLYKEQADPLYKEGFLESEILINEDSAQNFSGFITGQMATNFYLDEKNKPRYNDLKVGADGYFNNQCEAVWTSYTTGKNKICNWGDFRIPQSKDLDSGDGEFAVDKKFDQYGWKNYRIAWSGDPWKNGTGQARAIENKHWWE